MKKTANTIGIIGTGSVGTSFLYAAINQGLAANYVLIDTFSSVALGNALDLADAKSLLPVSFSNIKAGDYSDLKDADLIVITAGKPRRPEQSRLDIIAENALVMQEIGMKVKKSGFEGVTIIASNPVDVLTLIYQEATGFAPQKVIGSSTSLDSARLKRILGDKLDINPTAIDAYFMGEHGDSAVAIWSQATVLGQPIQQYLTQAKTKLNLQKIRYEAVDMGAKIISLKRATFYGIGTSLARIARAVLNDEKAVLVIGAKPAGEYQTKDVYIGVPAIVGQNGWEKIIEWKINEEEQELLLESVTILKDTLKKANENIQSKLRNLLKR